MHCLQRALSFAAALAVGATAYTTTTPAQAQDDELEEVIVTARKRDEALIEVPVAITAFSADQLDRGGFINLQDLSYQTAGLQFHKQGGQKPGRLYTAVRFRGMDTNQQAASQQLGTVFLDGVYMSEGISSIDFSNIERVEVIKGPQSATFGRSTFAGAVNYVTKTPGFEYAGRASMDFAEYGGRDLSFSHEGPIVDDKLAYRVSVRTYGTDGQYRSAADGGALGVERTDTVQGVLYWTPTENFSAKLRYMWSNDNDGPSAGFYLGSPVSARGSGTADGGTNCYSSGVTAPGVGGVTSDYYCGALPQLPERFIASNTQLTPLDRQYFQAPTAIDPRSGVVQQKIPDVPLVDFIGMRRYTRRAALLLDYEFTGGFLEGHTISSTTGWSDMKAAWVRDFDLTPAQNFLSQDPMIHEDFTQEIRLDSPQDQRFRYSVGVSYFDVDYVQQGNGGMNIWGSDGGVGQVVSFEPGSTTPIPTGPEFRPGPHTFISTSFPREGGTTTGIFGSLSFDITDRLTADFEWRSQDDDIEQDDRTTPGVDFEASFSSFLPRFTLSYNLNDNGTVWATYSEGNIPGFFNSDLAGRTQFELDQIAAQGLSATAFNDEEELENMEIGWKQRFDNGFYFSLVYYQMDWTNLKTRQGVPIFEEGTGVQRILNLQFNAGNAELDGFELEGGFSIGDNFSATFMANIVNGEYGFLTCGFSPFQPVDTTGAVAPGQRSCIGNTPSRYPESSYAFSGTWTDSLRSGNWDYFVRLDGEYFGKAFNEEANFSWIGEFWRFNLRGGFERENLRLEAYVRNLLDNDDYLAGARWSDFSGAQLFDFVRSQGVVVTPAEKRTIGLKLVYEF
jgi:iron complex outermembrane receptor protein